MSLWSRSLVACSFLVACDGNDDNDGSVGDVTQEVEDVAETVDTTPLDTALPFEVAPENKDLRNGIRARVGHVTDGDTLQVWVGTTAPRNYVVRMLGLAAPECFKDFALTPDGNKLVCSGDDELFGLGSYQLLKAMIENKQVIISCDVGPNEWCTQDPFDRYLAYISIDGKDASTEMARAGGGFSYTDFQSSKRADICRAEYEAQDAKRGMWALGTKSQVLAGMHSNTRGWYNQHDNRCNAAMGN